MLLNVCTTCTCAYTTRDLHVHHDIRTLCTHNKTYIQSIFWLQLFSTRMHIHIYTRVLHKYDFPRIAHILNTRARTRAHIYTHVLHKYYLTWIADIVNARARTRTHSHPHPHPQPHTHTHTHTHIQICYIHPICFNCNCFECVCARIHMHIRMPHTCDLLTYTHRYKSDIHTIYLDGCFENARTKILMPTYIERVLSLLCLQILWMRAHTHVWTHTHTHNLS